MTKYSKQLIVSCNENFRDILIAEFAAIEFDTFQETDEGFIAHSITDLSISQIEEIINRYQHQAATSYRVEEVEIENWNKIWEASFEPITIGNQCIVRAAYHSIIKDYPIEIIINPKMSFGTGHHETTYLMMKTQLDLDHQGKKVLDAGSGTGILSILAGKLGAVNILAYDNDEWVLDNMQENLKNNGIEAKVEIGTVETVSFDGQFDLVLANINKNILIHDLPFYSPLLATGGSLLLSGFYERDLPDVQEIAEQYQLKLVDKDTKNDWAVARFVKK